MKRRRTRATDKRGDRTVAAQVSKEQLDAECKKRDVSRSHLLRELIEKELGS